MANFSTYLEQQILNSLLRSAAAYKPSGVWIILYTSAPNDGGGGIEVAGGNYFRPQVTQADASWNAPSGSPTQVSNLVGINWGTATWTATVVAWGLIDSGTLGSGNMLMYYVMPTALPVNSGDQPQFASGSPGALVIQLD